MALIVKTRLAFLSVNMAAILTFFSRKEKEISTFFSDVAFMLKNAVASGRSPSHAAAKEEEESCVEGETAVPAVNVLGRVEQQPVREIDPDTPVLVECNGQDSPGGFASFSPGCGKTLSPPPSTRIRRLEDRKVSEFFQIWQVGMRPRRVRFKSTSIGGRFVETSLPAKMRNANERRWCSAIHFSNQGGGQSFATPFSPLDLTNIIYEVHMYVPLAYTHQGVLWKQGDGVPYPNAEKGWNAEALRGALRPVREFQLRHGAKIYCGEFSAVAWAPGADQYLRDCIDIFEEYGWDWSYHAFREWEGWSVEHEGPNWRGLVPAADTPRKKALLEGFSR